MQKALRRALWALPAATCIAAGLLYYSVKAPLPAEEGLHELAGLGAEVHVEFDELGIPRITAANAADAYHALGFVTARDRLFQMDLIRRQTAGRLAEIFGGAVLEEDRWNRVMGFAQLAGVIVSRLPEAQRHLLEAYSAGVNQAMAAARMFPVEFTYLGYIPEQWRPEDSILVTLAMHALLSWSGDQERTATVMRRALPPSVVEFLTPESDCHNEKLVPRNPARCAPGALPIADLISVTNASSALDEADHGTVSSAGRPRGSNAWVIGAAKSRDGRAILANDMHLELSVPNIWYRAELRYPGANLSGLTLPGFPLLIAGSSGHISWGLTSIEGDFADLVTIVEDEKNPNQYRTPAGLLSMEVRDEIIHVRGEADETLKVRTTIWGPVLPEPLLGRPVAAHWTALDPASSDLSLSGLAGVTTVISAIPLLNRAGGPPLNVLLSDSLGNIAWTYMGRIPRRRGMDGLFSESWADGRVGWDGYIPPGEMPNIVNPPEGYLVSANHRMLGADYSTVIGHDFSGGYRALQISERLKAQTSISERDMLALQLDTRTEFYRYYQQAALRALEGQSSQDQPFIEELRRYLEAWDGRAEADSLGLALLVEFRRELMNAVLAPLLAKCRKIDPAFSYYWSSADVPVQHIVDSGRVELLPDRKFHGWNGFLRAVLERSARTLMKRQDAMSLMEVRWGDVSRVEMRHPIAAGFPVLSSLLDMPRAPLAGCGHCIRFAGGSHGATGRMAVAPGHESEGILHMPGGQSGQPGSRHYSDQQESWVEGLPTRFSGHTAARRFTLKPPR